MLRSALLNVMVQTAFKAGRSLKRDFGEVERLQVSMKGPGNFVTAADTRAEEILRAELEKARPNYGFLGEEGGLRAGSDRSHTWIVDPLDGTTNFLHGIPQFSVSIALRREDTIVAGLVYNPVTDELFTAERGKGAVGNDRRLRVAARRRLADSVIACGLPHQGRGDLALFRREIAAVQAQVAGLRRFGSAALDLAWIAAGRFDGYWERNLSAWDVAAGILLVREAGGFVTDLAGGDTILESGDVIAGNEAIHGDLMRLLRESAETGTANACARLAVVADAAPVPYCNQRERDTDLRIAIPLRHLYA
jgi:myo-inositol-1(or 4)-monophosphatase